MKEVYLLLSAILFIVYIFATKDNPYIPIAKRPKPLGSKREIINWYAWKGPMFIEDFKGQSSESEAISPEQQPSLKECDNCPNKPFVCSHKGSKCSVNFVAPTLSDNPTNLPSDPVRCCQENELQRQKHSRDFQVCNREAMNSCRTPPSKETSQHSWENKYFNCSYVMRGPNWKTGDLGNYTQCTNNNLDVPNQLKCVGLGRIDADTCSPTHLVSHVCYKDKVDQCMQKKGHLKCSLGRNQEKCGPI